MIEFTCYCHPEPQGSANGFPIRRANGEMGVSITSSNKKLRPFRHAIACEAIRVTNSLCQRPVAAKHVPVSLEISCYFNKPPSVPKKRDYPVVKPDIDKLARAILDACTGILFADDAQVIQLTIRKHYNAPERVCVRMEVFPSLVGSTEDNPRPSPVFESDAQMFDPAF
jgi:Holliday junction resolvase RusA-like endonuclease